MSIKLNSDHLWSGIFALRGPNGNHFSFGETHLGTSADSITEFLTSPKEEVRSGVSSSRSSAQEPLWTNHLSFLPISLSVK